MNLRLGAVKQARREAGLSLAQVGKGHVTAPAIFLIETGRTRPSMPTLEHIARRTGKPIEFFLADPAGVTDETRDGLLRLESMIAEGANSQAIDLGQSLLNLGSSAHQLGPIRYYMAQAYLVLGKPDAAAGLLRQAHAHFELVGDLLMLAECMGAEAVLAATMQRPEALLTIEEALAVCRRLKPVPHAVEARLLGIRAAIHIANKEWDKAIDSYREAMAAAGSLHDLRRMAEMYEGLSVAHRDAGQADAATRYALRSLALLEVLRDRQALARIQNEMGLILLAKGESNEAYRHLDLSRELADQKQLEAGRSQILLSLCELGVQEGNLKAAGDFAREALLLAERRGEEVNVAEAHMWLGRVADQNGDPQAADREFELAINGLYKFGMTELLLRCHGMYAEILERRGDLERAYLHMKNALSASRPGLLRERDPGTAERAGSA